MVDRSVREDNWEQVACTSDTSALPGCLYLRVCAWVDLGQKDPWPLYLSHAFARNHLKTLAILCPVPAWTSPGSSAGIQALTRRDELESAL